MAPSTPILVRDLATLQSREWDLVVVGGGINGTGVARDAARRGLKVALVEKEDFGYGTTGRSTRLIHGGLRYLAMYDFGLVRESLRERERLFRAAPHLVKPLPFLVPIYKGQKPGSFMLRMGLMLYDWLSYDRSVPGRRWLSADQAVDLEPALRREGLTGAAMYYDGQIALVERLVLENALDASAHGACLANHVKVTEFLRDGARVTGVRAVDSRTGDTMDIRGKLVINASGPWLGSLEPDRKQDRSRMTKGIHLVIPKVTRHGILYFNQKDGRVFFAIPFQGQELVGTTDTDYRGSPDEVRAEDDDIAYLQRVGEDVLPGAPLADVAFTWAGIRNLVKVEGVSESAVSRKHLILDHEVVDGIPGLLSIVGGKITPYRSVCEETVYAAIRKLGMDLPPSTRESILPGGTPDYLTYVQNHVERDTVELGLPNATIRHLANVYGARHEDVLAYVRKDASLGKPFCHHDPTLKAEILHAMDNEMAVTLNDVVFRRTTLGMAACAATHVVDDVLEVMATHGGWDDARRSEERKAYEVELGMRRTPQQAPTPARGSGA